MVYSGLWNGVGGESYSLNSTITSNRYHLRRLLKKMGMRELGEVMFTLDGVTAGQAASATHTRVVASADTSSNVQGGARTVESHELVGVTLDASYNASGAKTARNTVAGDLVIINELYSGGTESNRAPGTYPTDASGNGGGGKLG